MAPVFSLPYLCTHRKRKSKLDTYVDQNTLFASSFRNRRVRMQAKRMIFDRNHCVYLCVGKRFSIISLSMLHLHWYRNFAICSGDSLSPFKMKSSKLNFCAFNAHWKLFIEQILFHLLLFKQNEWIQWNGENPH